MELLLPVSVQEGCLQMAATDSIRVVDDEYVRRIHSRNPSGHLHKGPGSKAFFFFFFLNI